MLISSGDNWANNVSTSTSSYSLKSLPYNLAGAVKLEVFVVDEVCKDRIKTKTTTISYVSNSFFRNVNKILETKENKIWITNFSQGQCLRWWLRSSSFHFGYMFQFDALKFGQVTWYRWSFWIFWRGWQGWFRHGVVFFFVLIFFLFYFCFEQWHGVLLTKSSSSLRSIVNPVQYLRRHIHNQREKSATRQNNIFFFFFTANKNTK